MKYVIVIALVFIFSCKDATNKEEVAEVNPSIETEISLEIYDFDGYQSSF